MRLFTLLLVPYLQATDYTLCASGCDALFTRANLETYFNTTASCGDTIKLGAGEVLTLTSAGNIALNKDCANNNRITLTSTATDDWLPDDTMRVTPSYAPLLPAIYRPASVAFSSGGPVLEFRRTTGPVNGITVKALELRSQPRDSVATSSYTNFSLLMGQEGVIDTTTTHSEDFTIKHIYFSTTSKTSEGLVGGCLNVAGSNVLMLGNWCDDIRIPNSLSGIQPESYGLLSRNGGTGYTFRNNFLNACVTEGVIIGGGDAPAGQVGHIVPSNWDITGNYWNKPAKCYPNTTDYWGFQSVLKNFLECKSCQNLTASFNGGNRAYEQSGAQWFAVTMTTRVGMSAPGYNLGTPTLRTCLDGTKTIVSICWDDGGVWTTCTDMTCTWWYYPGWAVGGGVAICTVTGGSCNVYTEVEARAIVTVNSQWQVEVDPAFVTAIDEGAAWAATAPFNKVQNVTIQNNFWKNIAQEVNWAACDTALSETCANGMGGSGGNLRYINNLTVADEPEWMNCCGMALSTLNVAYMQGVVNYAPTVNRWERNTRYHRVGAGSDTSAMDYPRDAAGRLKINVTGYFTGDSSPALTTEMQYNNNLFPPRVNAGMTVGDLTSKTANNAQTTMLYTTAPESGLAVVNLTPCTGSRNCQASSAMVQATFDPGFVSEAGNDYGLNRTSNYAGACYGGADCGVDMAQIPAIQYLRITAAANYLTFGWRLTRALQGATCQLEVSTDSGLVTSLASYTVVNSLRPDYFQRGDADKYSAYATGFGTANRTMQAGADATVLDDNGVSRNLRLSPGTYYYRLMCGGALETGSTVIP